MTSFPAAKNASGSNGVSSSGNSSSIPKAEVIFFRNDPSPIVSLRGSLIWLSVYLATAVSNITADSQIVSIRFTCDSAKAGDSIISAASSFPLPTGLSSMFKY